MKTACSTTSKTFHRILKKNMSETNLSPKPSVKYVYIFPLIT